ncbi:nucleotidyltransferase domain-containing protein [Paenibacillus gansuensis]|uniref:Nucleotidyltransferase domain-containing protein n=1 Tax=Paenibacillus gansuensis TaxID=306542 RepID=A0ABW5PJV7_9BACL
MLPETAGRTMSRLCELLEGRTTIVKSVYLYGSVALGDYIEGSSDIDFVAVLRESPSEEEVKLIAASHAQVEEEFPGTDIMGSYLLEQDLGEYPTEKSVLLTYYNRQLNADRTGADLNPITWWILKHHGVRVHGQELQFSYNTDASMLVRYVKDNLNSYWAGKIVELETLRELADDAALEGMTERLDEAVEWCVLGMLRQLYTIKEHGIKSKSAAGWYGLANLPERWHPLIKEAIHIKRLSPERLYSSNVQRLADLIALLRWIRDEANGAGAETNTMLRK